MPVQCLFPLVKAPLDNIRAILSSSQDVRGCKRKFCPTLENKEPELSHKCWSKEDPDIVFDGQCQNKSVSDCSVSVKSIEQGLLVNNHQEQQCVENADKSTEAPHVTTRDTVLQIGNPVSSSPVKVWKRPPVDLSMQDLVQMVPTRQHLFWKNKDNLCWLDSLLVALVHSRIIREGCENVCLNEELSCKQFTVKILCATYKKSYAHIKAKEQHCQGW